MKNTFRKILAIGATLALLSGLAVAAPVSAAPGCNTWDDISMPVLAPDTEPGVMAIAPDGSRMFLALYYEGDYAGDEARTWEILYSDDGGFTWKKTNMPAVSCNNPSAWTNPNEVIPVKIEVSPMWPDNKNVYVALSSGDVWRLPNGGEGTPAPLREILSETGFSMGYYDAQLWDMDIYAYGGYNYLAVATDLDVFVIKDALLEEWVDYQLNVDDEDDWRYSVEVRFDPKFSQNELIWAVAEDEFEGDLVLTSADSPARWAYKYDEVPFIEYDDDPEDWTPFVDMEFDPAHTTALPRLYVAIADDNPMTPEYGNLYYVDGEAEISGPGPMFSTYIFFEDQALGTVEVSGGVIMVQNTWTGDVYITEDGGANWDLAFRSPNAPFWGQLYMHPNFATNKTAYSTVMDYDGYSGVGGVYMSTDGGYYWDGIGMLDMRIDEIVDLGFDPQGGSQPALMVVRYYQPMPYDYIFYTADATAATPRWLLKDSELNFIPDPLGPWFGAIEMVSWDTAGDTVMLLTRQGMPDDDAYSIYRSTDDGNSFKYWRSVPTATIGWPKDWVVVSSTVVNMIGSDGYWGTRTVGTPVTNAVDVDSAGIDQFVSCSIARSASGLIAVGLESGVVGVSADNGISWETATITDADEVYVAFGPDNKLYAATNQGGRIVGIDTSDATVIGDLDDSYGYEPMSEGFSGIWVSPDNTLYAIGELVIPGSVKGVPTAIGGVSLANDNFLYGTSTVDLEDLAGVIAEEAVDSDSSISFSVISGTFNDGEILYVVGDDLVFGSPELDFYLQGSILVQGAESGAFGRISLWVSVATADYMVDEGLLVYTDGWTDTWPEEGVSVTITSSAMTVDYVNEEGEEATATTLFRLLLGATESTYNAWQFAPISSAAGIWGTSGSNIVWTVVEGDELWALEDFNSGTVQGVSVVEVDKSAATASKNLSISWKTLACTSCYTIWIDGEPYDDYNVTGTIPDAGTTITVKLTGFEYAKKYNVQVQACIDGPLQSRLSSVGSTTTECYLLAPVPQVPVNGMQDASIAPSFVWGLPVDGCDPTSYEFQLSTDPNFTTTIVSTTVTGTGYTYAARDLAYDTNHYWRVRSVVGSLKSAWTSVQNFHTMLEPQPPVTIPPQPTPTISVTVSVPPANTITIPPAQTVTVPPAVTFTQTVTQAPDITLTVPEQETPVYIWVIVAIGALLVIAVIVLIIRTRRAE